MIRSNTILLLIFILSSSISFSQRSIDYLKAPEVINSETPDWALEMYAENPNVVKVDRLYQNYYSSQLFKKSYHTQNYKHWRRAIEKFIQPDGYLKIPNTQNEYKKGEGVIKKRKALEKALNSWSPIGPFDTFSTDENQVAVSWQANVYTIDQSQSNPNVVYVGSEAGGIFKSIDKGMNWTFASWNANIRTVTAIKVDPNNDDIVYAGDGGQVYKTTNGGENWDVILNEGGLGVNDISINPKNNQLIFAGTNLGLYRSENGGGDWTKVMQEKIWDIEVQYGQADNIFILMSNTNEVKTEFWKSTDQGLSFSKKENGWYTSNDPARVNGGARMTVTPADDNRIYVILIGASKPGDNGYIGVYRSMDGGESWTLTDPPIGGPYDDGHNNLATLSNTNTLQQGYYNLSIAASHTNADDLLVGALNLWKSNNGGSSFQALGGYQGNISWIHPDQQEIEINGNDMWVVNDGGINYSTNLFNSHESRKKGLMASDFWGFGSGWNEDLVVGGRYHNGNTAYRPTFEDGQFLRLGGAEASTGYVQPGGESISYFSDIDAKKIPYNLTDAVVNVGNLSVFPSESYFAAHSSELEFASNCYGHIYIGRENKLWKSEDNGNTFDLINEFGNTDQPLMQFEISRIDNDVMYVYQRSSFYGATLWLSLDGGITWEAKEFPAEPSSMRAGVINISSQNPGTLWVGFAHQNNDGAKIYQTNDFGDTWDNITSTALDGETIHCLFHHAGTDSDLYLGTDYGIYYYNGTAWTSCQDGLPARLNTNKFQPFYKENKLRVATYGNGIWEMDLVKKTSPQAQPTVNKLTSNCSRDTFYFDDYSVLGHENATWTWSFDPDPLFVSDYNVRNPKVVFGEMGSYDVSMTVENSEGSDSFVGMEMIEILDNACQPDIIPGMALECNQTGDDFVQLPAMNLTSETFTMTAWIKPNGIQNAYTGIIMNDDAATGLNFTQDNTLGFHYQDAGSAAWAWDSGLIVPDDEWSYVAMVVSEDQVVLYLNGEGVQRDLSLLPADLGTMKIGSYRGWGDRNFNGLIDEVTIWNRSLSRDEIRVHRHITKNNDADGLIAYYQFNEIDGGVLDRVGLRHGNIRGSSQRVISSASIGKGTATLSQGAETVFNIQGQDVDYVFVGKEGSESFVGTQINVPPLNTDITDLVVENKYWIFNQYDQFIVSGANFELPLLDAYYVDHPEDVTLFARGENDSESPWQELNVSKRITNNTSSRIEFDMAEVEGKQLLVAYGKIASNTKEIEKEALTIYPNPNDGSFEVSVDNLIGKMFIYNAKGQKILERQILFSQRMDLGEQLESGEYIYLFETANKIKTGKLVIAK